MARQNTWGIANGIPKLTSLGTGISHTPIAPRMPQGQPILGKPVNTTTSNPGAAGGVLGSSGDAYSVSPNYQTYLDNKQTVAYGTQPESQWPAQQDKIGSYINPAKQTQQTLPDGTTVGGYGDAGGSYWGGNGFYATPEEAAANLDYLDKVQGSNMGEGVKKVLDYASQHGLRPDPTKWNSKVNQGVNTAIDAATGLPFGIGSTLLNPSMKETPWGTDFNTGGGGLIGLGGNLSLKNLENQYYKTTGGLNHQGVAVGQEGAKYSIGKTEEGYTYGGKTYPSFAQASQAQDKDMANTHFYAPGSLPGIMDYTSGKTPTTPIAVHEGFIPGTQVVSGNTDLLPPQVDANGDGIVSATEVQALANPNSAVAKQVAQINANKAAANALAQQQQQQAQDDNKGHYSGGTAVTDSHGNAVKDNSGNVVTSGGSWSAPKDDNDSGGGSAGGK